jgi:hypothetical protein
VTVLDFASRLWWLDGRPALAILEPYRLRLLDLFFSRDADGLLRYNLGLFGRAKKNWKSADLDFAALFALVSESPAGHDSECYILANDEDQARDDLALAKKIISVNPALQDWLRIKKDVIERKDGRGFLEILPAGNVTGQHGKSYRFVGYDEIHGYRTWDIFEAMQPDPHRLDAQQWITSYASIFHRPGVPLFDLLQQAKAGTDPRTLFSWYAADYCTDPAFDSLSPEQRANPSMASWPDQTYLAQQQRRLPAHKYRRLHLNLPGLPEGSAFQPDSIMDAVERGTALRPPTEGIEPCAFVDMSGGSNDDAVLGIGHRDANGRHILDLLMNQGPRPPFDPNRAVERFVQTLKDYGCTRVTGDRYAGQTFAAQFQAQGILYTVCDKTASQLYEAFEPLLNAKQIVLLDVPVLEQQLLGLVWRGGKIDHQPGEHDDFANAAAGVLVSMLSHRTAADNARDARAFASILATARPSKWGNLDGSYHSDGLPVRSAEYDPDSEDGDQIYTYRFM